MLYTPDITLLAGWVTRLAHSLLMSLQLPTPMNWYVLATAVAVATVNSLVALPVAVGESGDLRASAFNVNGYFSPNANPNVFGSLPTATVHSQLGAHANDVDWYAFTGAGIAYFDIDDNPYTHDTTLALFDSSGTLLAYDDDSFPEDPGTEFGFDSFLGVYTLPSAGTYYLGVSRFANFPTAVSSASFFDFLTRPDGWDSGGFTTEGATPGDDSWDNNSSYTGLVDYTLHISVEGAAAASVPDTASTLVLLSASMFVLTSLRRRFSLARHCN